jgi:hypothetical protein
MRFQENLAKRRVGVLNFHFNMRAGLLNPMIGNDATKQLCPPNAKFQKRSVIREPLGVPNCLTEADNRAALQRNQSGYGGS